MPEHTGKAVIGREYLEKYKDFPTKSIARKMYQENKFIFSSVEDARDTLRYLRGARGRRLRKDAGKFREHWRITDKHNPFDLPEPIDAEVRPYILPKEASRMLIISDIHIPFHDLTALSLALQYGVEIKVNAVMALGDVSDFYAISKFLRDPRLRDFRNEILQGREFWTKLRKLFPKALIYCKLGNHEARWDSYLMTHAPELMEIQDLIEADYKGVMKLASLDIETIDDKAKIYDGHLTLIHGHELMGMGSNYNVVSPARGYHIRSLENVLGGDHHRTSENPARTLRDKVIGAWSIGCLCSLHPRYLPNNRWNQGFAYRQRFEDDMFEVKNFKIIDGRIR